MIFVINRRFIQKPYSSLICCNWLIWLCCGRIGLRRITTIRRRRSLGISILSWITTIMWRRGISFFRRISCWRLSWISTWRLGRIGDWRLSSISLWRRLMSRISSWLLCWVSSSWVVHLLSGCDYSCSRWRLNGGSDNSTAWPTSPTGTTDIPIPRQQQILLGTYRVHVLMLLDNCYRLVILTLPAIKVM